MPNAAFAAFEALDPFFRVVQLGLSGFVDGEHYFDTISAALTVPDNAHP